MSLDVNLLQKLRKRVLAQELLIQNEGRSSQYIRNFCSWEKKAWKKFRLVRDSKPAVHIYDFHIFITSVNHMLISNKLENALLLKKHNINKWANKMTWEEREISKIRILEKVQPVNWPIEKQERTWVDLLWKGKKVCVPYEHRGWVK